MTTTVEEEEEEEEEDVVDYDTPPASREGPALAASSEQNTGALVPYTPPPAPMQLDERPSLKRPREEGGNDEVVQTPTLPRISAPLGPHHACTAMTLICTTRLTTLTSLVDLRATDRRMVVCRSTHISGSSLQLTNNQGTSVPAPPQFHLWPWLRAALAS